MIHLDKYELENKWGQIVEDVDKKELTSLAWLWAGVGAVAGLVLSCVRFKRKETKPFLATYDKKGAPSGKLNSKWNSKNNKRFGSQENK